MRSLRALTWLLVLLVLVPAGVLAWLGFQAADGWDAAVEAQIRRDLDEAEVEAREVGLRVQREAAEGLEENAAWLAAKVYAELPLSTPRAVLDRYEKQSFWMVGGPDGADPLVARTLWLQLLDAQGRPLGSTAYRPPEEQAAASELEALLDGLRREADRRQFGEGDTPAALRVWQEARTRLPGDRLRATCDVEAALVELRGSEGRGADALAHDLERRWPLPVLYRVGRPIARLWLAAAAEAESPWLERLRDERLADVPLTDAERGERSRLSLKAMGASTWSPPPGAKVRVVYLDRMVRSAPVTDQVQLQVTYDAKSLHAHMRDRIRDLGSWGSVRLSDVRDARDPTGIQMQAHRDLDEVAVSRFVPLSGEGDLAIRIRLDHTEARELLRGRDVRRRLVMVGVLSLLALTVVGLVLVRRAVRRERDARRLRDDFIANVSHELRTPLTSVCLHAEMLSEEDPPADRRRELARVVKAEGGRLAALVDDLLDFAALEQGVRRIEPEPVDLARAVREAAAPYATLAEREGVALEVGVPDGELVALADAHALSRILANLLSNAWRHGRPSQDGAPGRIGIRAYDGAEPADGATVEVRDDGPGIPADERGTVFARFHRGRASTRVEGTGLGLALGRELAHSMGGDLQLGEEKLGTVFRLTLPPLPTWTLPDGEA